MDHFLSQRVLACVCVSMASFLITGCGSVSAVHKAPTYNLHGKPQMSGAVVRSELRFKLSEGNILITVGDRTIQGQMDMSGLQVTEDEVMAFAEERPAVVKVRYVTDQMETRQAIGDKVSEGSERGPLHGRTVIGEMVSDHWRFKMAQGNPTRLQTQALRELAGDFGAEFYPARPLSVGESWEVPAQAVKRWLGHDLIRSEGTAVLTLEKITEHEGERCAKVLMEISAGGSMLDPDGNELEITIGVDGYIYRSLETYVDLAGEMEGLMILEGEVKQDGSLIGIKVTGPIRVSGSNKLKHPESAARRVRPR